MFWKTKVETKPRYRLISDDKGYWAVQDVVNNKLWYFTGENPTVCPWWSSIPYDKCWVPKHTAEKMFNRLMAMVNLDAESHHNVKVRKEV